MSEKNYYLEYTITRNSLTEPFGSQTSDPSLAKGLIAKAEEIYRQTGAEKSYQASPDGLSLVITVKFKTLESRDAVIKIYEEETAKNKDFVDDHNHLNIEYKLFETDA